MNKKLMAVAVAGALAAPAVALAQASTVQIYGYLNAEYGFAKGVQKAAGKTNSWDGLNSSASYIGFKGEEKLSGGMSAFFQCETDVGFLKGDSVGGVASTATQGGWCSRNSAVGLKGGFGSFYIGTWDSPTKRAVSATRILGETGWHGVQSFLLSNSGTFTGTYSARNANSINYDSPNFSGFSVSAQTTSTKDAATTVAAGLKGRSNSFSLNYAGGPMTAVVSYVKLDDNRAPTGVNGAESEATVLGGTYTFGAAKLGIVYTDAKVTSAVGAELERKSWNIAGTYNLGGPHAIVAGYTLAGDTKTNAAVPAAGTGSDTGAKQYTIGYTNALSKRTTASLTYMRAKNDSNGNNYSVGNSHLGGGAVNGSSSSVIATRLQHSF